ncbi:hypothetical protein [Helicobacter felistomachi]|nr:hypothetical protein [Helicobacter sp. NHP21005]
MKFIVWLLLCASLNAMPLQLVKKEGSKNAPTLLLMGDSRR